MISHLDNILGLLVKCSKILALICLAYLSFELSNKSIVITHQGLDFDKFEHLHTIYQSRGDIIDMHITHNEEKKFN